MKTKHRILSVLTILALVASLCAVMVAPAAAADPAITLDPPSGRVGTLVTVTATGFPADHPLILEYRGVAVVTTPAVPETDEDGQARIFFRVPESPKGLHWVNLVAGVISARTRFDVVPRITISPTAGAPESTATAALTGFAPNVSIDVFATDPVPDELLGSGTTDGKGSATVSVTMYKDGVISATDGAGNPAHADHRASFAFVDDITLDPATGPVGTLVTVEGRNFTIGGNIPANHLIFAGDQYSHTAKPFTDRDQDGIVDDFTMTFRIPVTSPGGKVVRVTDNDGLTDTAIFVVTATSITLTPSAGPVGTTVTISGTGFVPGETVTVTPEGVTAITATAADDGTFTVTFASTAQTSEVIAVGEYGALARAEFDIPDPIITLSPTAGLPGTLVTVTGTGFPGFHLAVLEIEDVPLPPPVLTDAAGNFVATFIVPGLPAIRHTVSAAVGVVSDTAPFDVGTAPVDVAVALHTIEGLYTIVWGFDAEVQEWRFFDPAAPQVSDLETLVRGMGYWIYVTQDATIIHGGNVYRLDEGWNLIGWLG